MTQKTKSPETIRKLKIYTKLLPCKLTDEELLGYGSDLASIIQDISVEEDRQTSLKQELKARLASLESQGAVLTTKITRKEELRDVDIQPAINFKEGVYREVRLDSGELIWERPVTDEERQEHLPLDQAS